MEDCFSCKVISTGAFLASSAYLAYGAKFWTTDRRVNKRFLYPFSAGNAFAYALIPQMYSKKLLLVLLVAGISNWIIRSKNEENNKPTPNS